MSKEDADIVKRKLLGLEICPGCNREVPAKELILIARCDKCWSQLNDVEKLSVNLLPQT